MRAPVFWVGRTTFDGRLTLALEIKAAVLPLMKAPVEGEGHSGARIVGKMSRFRFEDGGLVTTWLEVDDGIDLKGMTAEADLDQVEIQHGEDDGLDHLVFTSGRLRAATLGTRPCWPDMVIQ